jgi:hypothetical protein
MSGPTEAPEKAAAADSPGPDQTRLAEAGPATSTLGRVENGGIWGWLERHPRRSLAISIGLSIVLLLPFLSRPLSNDEGGFLFVAEQWGLDASELYGDQWVDRPPLLLLVFKVVALLGGSLTIVRLLAFPLTVVTVVAAWWAGHSINGSRGAVVAALVTATISSNFWIDGYQLTGEKLGGAFVMLSCAMTLAAWRGRYPMTQSILLALGAGFTAGCAFLTKQSFIDAGIFAAVLLLLPASRHWRLLGAGVVGLAIPLGATVLWANSSWGPGFTALWDAVFTFRRDAVGVLATTGLDATNERAHELIWLSILSGVAVVAVFFLAEMWSARHEWRLATAILVMLLYDVAVIWIGGSYWAHYLLGLVAPLALAASFASITARPRVGVHAVVAVVTLAGLAGTIGGLIKIEIDGTPGQRDVVIGEYLREAAEPGDTVFVAYGSPTVINASGLGTTYPYSWSLPIRVRDPELTQLTALLKSAEAPTWIVEIGEFDWWGLDTPEFRELRETRYELVANVCGKDIFLRIDARRELPPTPDCD